MCRGYMQIQLTLELGGVRHVDTCAVENPHLTLLGHLRILVSWGFLEPIPRGYQGTTVTRIQNQNYWNRIPIRYTTIAVYTTTKLLS